MPLSPALSDLAAHLSAFLPDHRLEHCRNVAVAARGLAERFAAELADQAELAGLLHDNAKGLTAAELTATARRFDIEMTAGELAQPGLLHGKVGAALLAERFGVTDPLVAQAVADHVTGRTNMDRLSRIIFVADQIAADRDFPGVAQLRRTACRDLDAATLLVARHKLIYIVQHERRLELMTVEVYNELLSRKMVHGA